MSAAQILLERETAAGRRGGITASRWAGVGLPALGFAIGIAVWWLVVELFEVESFLVPTPGAVVVSLVDNAPFLLEQTWVTAWETVQGFVAATVPAVPLAVLLASSRVAERTISPMLLTINSLPKVAIAPILVVWMGFGQLPKIVMVVLLCFFPIVLAAAAGLRATPAEIVELGRSLDAGRVRFFLSFRLPHALPRILVGLKTAVSLAVIGAVIAEFVGADAGLGFVVVQSGASSDTALAFAAMLLLGILSIVLFSVVEGLERIMVPWAEESR